MEKRKLIQLAEQQNLEEVEKIINIYKSVLAGADPDLYIPDLDKTLEDLDDQIELYSSVDDIDRIKGACVYKSIVQDCLVSLLKKKLGYIEIERDTWNQLYIDYVNQSQ